MQFCLEKSEIFCQRVVIVHSSSPLVGPVLNLYPVIFAQGRDIPVYVLSNFCPVFFLLASHRPFVCTNACVLHAVGSAFFPR